MSVALTVPDVMTLTAFLAWDAPLGVAWQLVDGVPVAMAPTSPTHGTIQAELGGLLRDHLRAAGNRCRVVANPGVIPRVGSNNNFRIPDLRVTCEPIRRDDAALRKPVLLVQILSPSNRGETWTNVWAFTTIPSLSEILVVRTEAIGCLLLRRGHDGTWPENPTEIGDGDLTLSSIGFATPVGALYAGTWLAAAG
ncbi:MAG: Uma2 family endonuclease [Acetobacteraceae bacterium]